MYFAVKFRSKPVHTVNTLVISFLHVSAPPPCSSINEKMPTTDPSHNPSHLIIVNLTK